MVFRFLRLTIRDVPSLSKYVADRYCAIIRVTKFLVNFFLAPRFIETIREITLQLHLQKDGNSLLRKYVITIVGRINTFKNWENKNEMKAFAPEAPSMLESNLEKS